MNPYPQIPAPPCARRFPCRKCGGSGNVGYRRAGGVCFKCDGSGINRGAYNDAVAAHNVAMVKWRAECDRIAEDQAATHERLCAERGEPTCPFARFIANLPLVATA